MTCWLKILILYEHLPGPSQTHLSPFIPLLSGISPRSPLQKRVMPYTPSPDRPDSLLRSSDAISNPLSFRFAMAPKIYLIWSTIRKCEHWILKLISRSGHFPHKYLSALGYLTSSVAGNPFINCCSWYKCWHSQFSSVEMCWLKIRNTWPAMASLIRISSHPHQGLWDRWFQAAYKLSGIRTLNWCFGISLSLPF